MVLSLPEPMLKLVSKAPVEVSRATRLRFCPETVVKNPPMSTFPSGCITTELTEPFAPARAETEGDRLQQKTAGENDGLGQK